MKVSPVVVVAVQTAQTIVVLVRFIVLVADPEILKAPEVVIVFEPPTNVPVKAPIVTDVTDGLRAVSVTVPAPEFPSKVTVSPAPGTVCPPAPPEEAAQLVTLIAVQAPVPPTQNLLAID